MAEAMTYLGLPRLLSVSDIKLYDKVFPLVVEDQYVSYVLNIPVDVENRLALSNTNTHYKLLSYLKVNFCHSRSPTLF